MVFKKRGVQKCLDVFALAVRPTASCHFNSCFSPVSDAAGLKTEPSQSCSIKRRFCSNRERSGHPLRQARHGRGRHPGGLLTRQTSTLHIKNKNKQQKKPSKRAVCATRLYKSEGK